MTLKIEKKRKKKTGRDEKKKPMKKTMYMEYMCVY